MSFMQPTIEQIRAEIGDPLDERGPTWWWQFWELLSGTWR